MSNLDYILSRVKKLPEAYIAEEICRKACNTFNLNIKEVSVLKEFLTPITLSKNDGVRNNDTLHPFNNNAFTDPLTPLTPITPKNNNTEVTNLTLEDFEERAAIIEYDANIPRDWAEAIAKTQTRSKPKTIAINKWVKIQTALEMVLPHLKDMIAHDWKIGDVFGCHRSAPEARYDVMGLLMLLNEGDTIVEISKDAIIMQNKRGSVQSYRRPFYNYQTEQSCLHE